MRGGAARAIFGLSRMSSAGYSRSTMTTGLNWWRCSWWKRSTRQRRRQCPTAGVLALASRRASGRATTRQGGRERLWKGYCLLPSSFRLAPRGSGGPDGWVIGRCGIETGEADRDPKGDLRSSRGRGRETRAQQFAVRHPGSLRWRWIREQGSSMATAETAPGAMTARESALYAYFCSLPCDSIDVTVAIRKNFGNYRVDRVLTFGQIATY
jgi:hypothetical protein